MSLNEYSTSASNATPKVDEPAEDDTVDLTDKNTKDVGDECATPDRTIRDHVLKQVGITSTAFIGPAFPPQRTAPKSDIEDSLSEFYKELEKVEKTDGANGKPRNQHFLSLKKRPRRVDQHCPKEQSFNAQMSPEKDFQQEQSWPQWFDNEPYDRRGSQPSDHENNCGADFQQNHWCPPQPLNRPPFRNQPPSYVFPSRPHPPPHANSRLRAPHMTNELRFPRSVVPSHPSWKFDGKPSHPFEGNQQCYDTDSQSDHPAFREERTERWSPMNAQTQRENDEDVWLRCHPSEPGGQSCDHNEALVLILMRGLPGCGKSTRARELLSTGPSGIILSTDDYFAHEYGYRYEAGLLRAAHEWNQHRAKDALNEGRSPVIVDNTNLQAWEMKPYVKMALERGYTVDFCEPQTSWKFNPFELERRNKHKVSHEKIAQMMDRYLFPISVDIVLSSQDPPHVMQQRQPPQAMKRKHDFD